MNVKKLISLKKNGLCFKDITYSEILICLQDSTQFLNKRFEDQIKLKNHNLFLSLTFTSEKNQGEGLITMKVFNDLTDRKNNEEIGLLRFAIHKNSVFLGCIQTTRNQVKIKNLSKKVFKTQMLNVLFKCFKQFLSNQSINTIYCTTMNLRCYTILDANHILKTNYDELFKSFGGTLENNRWKFTLI